VLAALIVGGSRPRRLNGRLFSCVPIAAQRALRRSEIALGGSIRRRGGPYSVGPPRQAHEIVSSELTERFRGRSRGAGTWRGWPTSTSTAPSEAGAASRPRPQRDPAARARRERNDRNAGLLRQSEDPSFSPSARSHAAVDRKAGEPPARTCARCPRAPGSPRGLAGTEPTAAGRLPPCHDEPVAPHDVASRTRPTPSSPPSSHCHWPLKN